MEAIQEEYQTRIDAMILAIKNHVAHSREYEEFEVEFVEKNKHDGNISIFMVFSPEGRGKGIKSSGIANTRWHLPSWAPPVGPALPSNPDAIVLDSILFPRALQGAGLGRRLL